MPLNNKSLESILDEAKEHEKRYEWTQAVKVYEKASLIVQKNNDYTKIVEILEKIGFCYFRAALQAQNNEENIDRIKYAIKSYQEAVELVDRVDFPQKRIRINQNKAWIKFLNSWLETDVFKKKSLLDEWWKLEKETLKIFNEQRLTQDLARECGKILELGAATRFFFPAEAADLKKITEENIQLGEQAIELLSGQKEDFEIAKLYCWTSWFYGFSVLYQLNENKREEYGERSSDYSTKALRLSKKTGDAWLIGWSHNAASLSAFGYRRNLDLSMYHTEAFVKQGRIARDHYMLGVGPYWKGMLIYQKSLTEEDPEKQRNSFRTALQHAEESAKHVQITNFIAGRLINYRFICENLEKLASYETDKDEKRSYFEKIIKTAKETLDYAPENYQYSTQTYDSMSRGFKGLSEITSNINDKRQPLFDALKYKRKANQLWEKFGTISWWMSRRDETQIQISLAKIEENEEKKNGLLEDAIKSVEKHLILLEKRSSLVNSSQEWTVVHEGNELFQTGRTLYELFSLTKKDTLLTRAIETIDKAIVNYTKTEHFSNLAEAYWQKAKIQDQLKDQLSAAKNFHLASEAYIRASEVLSNLKNYYANHSIYMQAWSKIEEAKFSHSREDYQNARVNYEKVGKLHEGLDNWSYLSPNYFAWAKLEQAEESSRKEKPQEAISNFQEAIENFKNTEINLKTKINVNPAAEEMDLITGILKASGLRQRYCQARILMEEAKLLDRQGKFLDSSTKYGEASNKISAIVDKVETDIESKELEYLAILCRAWEKMAKAEEATSAESYLEAAELFEEAKDYCFTRKASLWALGNCNFCKGLAAGLQYKSSLDLSDHAKAKGYIKTASTDYLQAGFKQASEYAKATQRLFDAYLSMNQAEMEADQEKRAKHYQVAENLLQVAAGSFLKAKQPEKQAQVQEILANVKEEKALAASLSQVMQAPSIASSTLSFSAPSPTSESSVGLEKFEHANVQANLVTQVKEVNVGESFCLSVEFINAGREAALLMRVDDFVPSDFIVVKKPEIYRMEDTTLNMKGKQLAPLKFVEVKLTLQPSKKGEYQLNPKVIYLDEMGQNKSLQLKTVEISVEEFILQDRVSTGTQELDSLLFGGIPKEYAVVLTSSPCDEREMIVKNFLKEGVKDGISFYMTTEATDLEDLLNKPSFFLFLCNPKPKVDVPDLTNVFKFQGKTDLTNLGIALVKAQRSLNQSVTNKRICVEILSDVLVKHGTNTTREWISGLITNLGAKGFTMLAVMNPAMHPPDQATAVLDLFDGEISITQSDDPLDCKKSILVKKLRNQDYIKNPICLR